MSETTLPLLSVRGEAHRTVTPDAVTLSGALTVMDDSKPEALQRASAALEALITTLRDFGGKPRTADSEKPSLTWLAYSATTHEEKEQDPQTGHHTGPLHVRAWVIVAITVRDFALLDRLGAALGSHEALSINQTSWNVDEDNPAWKSVRAEAIYSAIAKGRDYAAALGGSLTEVLHIADVGLLSDGGSPSPARYSPQALSRGAFDAGMGASGAPSLDPVPQELGAAIEARFTMTPVDLEKA